jgi:hypothetical protein
MMHSVRLDLSNEINKCRYISMYLKLSLSKYVHLFKCLVSLHHEVTVILSKKLKSNKEYLL